MIAPSQIDPHAVYDDGAIVIVLDIPSTTLARARHDGTLQYVRKGRRILYLGKWILDWLEKGAKFDGGKS
jgi:hypothetical protein